MSNTTLMYQQLKALTELLKRSMSKQDDDEARWYRCYKKYGKMVNQALKLKNHINCVEKCKPNNNMSKQVKELDDIAEAMNAARSKLSKEKKNSGGEKGSCSGAAAASGSGSVSADNQDNFNQVIVETITKFLNDLNEDSPNNDPKPPNP